MTNLDADDAVTGSVGVTGLGDADLVLRTRAGDRTAFGELWRRHYRSGVTVARSVTTSFDPDDLVQESFTRIYQAIAAGGGPTGSFRAYLFTSIRNTAASWGRTRRETAVDTLDVIEDPATTDEATNAALDRSITHRAFQSLPTRWQEVLWYSEIERMKPAEIAPLLGMKPTAVAQLTFRAREGLREAWIQAHLRSVEDGSDCQWTIEHLGAYARAKAGRRDRVKVERHLAGCARCAIVAGEAKEVSDRLALVLLPLAIGAVGATGYLASLQLGAAPLAVVAAMPTTVTIGGVSAAPAAAAGSLGVAAASGTAAGAAGAGSGIFAGVGTMVGVAAASVVVVVGAVVTVAPGFTPTTDVAHGETAIVQPVAPTTDPLDSEIVAADSHPAVAEAEPPTPGSGDQSDAPDPAAAEEASPSPENVVVPAAEPPAAVPEKQSGHAPEKPATPAQAEQAPADPGPALRDGSPTIASSSSSVTPGTDQVTIEVFVTGDPGATVQARIRGSVRATATIDSAGSATLQLQPSAQELRVDSRVELRYVDDKHKGTPISARLAELL